MRCMFVRHFFSLIRAARDREPLRSPQGSVGYNQTFFYPPYYVNSQLFKPLPAEMSRAVKRYVCVLVLFAIVVRTAIVDVQISHSGISNGYVSSLITN